MATMEERFWKNVNRRGPNECWLWAKKLSHGGYGRFCVGKHPDGKVWREQAHRVAFFLVNGHWPEPFCLHKCPGGENRACCNPAHLQEGTQQENVTDRDASGRTAHGSRNGQAKLTEWEIPYIHALIKAGVSKRAIARAYEVAQPQIGRIARNETWKSVETASLLRSLFDDDKLETFQAIFTIGTHNGRIVRANE